MSGAPYGLDIAAAARRAGSEFDREIMVRLLGAIEAGGVTAMARKVEEDRDRN